MLAFSEFEQGMSIELTPGGKANARGDPDFWKGRPRGYNSTYQMNIQGT